MRLTRTRKAALAATVCASSAISAYAAPLSTSVNYQGQLKQGGITVSDTCVFEFTLWDDPVASHVANQVGPTLSFDGAGRKSPPIDVNNGLFEAALDFGPGAFDGTARWLEISVCCSFPCGPPYTTLAPRQPLTATPYALFAMNGGGSGGDGHSLDAADGQPVDALFVNEDGDVGIGTTTPLVPLHVAGNSQLGGDLAVDTDTLFVDATQDRVGIGTNSPSAVLSVKGAVSSTSDSSTLGEVRLTRPLGNPGIVGIADNGNRRDIRFTDDGISLVTSSTNSAPGANNGIRIDENGNVGINRAPGDNTPLGVDLDEGAVVINRSGDGLLFYFFRDGLPVGNISVSGNTVTYAGFTGAHHVWADQNLEAGWLLTMTGQNRNVGADTASEIQYGVVAATRANDSRCGGSFLGVIDPQQPLSTANPMLMAAVGNGDMWVVETGRNLEPGDLLISSNIRGHAMLDDESQFAVGYIVARVAQPVDWSKVSETIEGRKHKNVSVFFENFVRSNAAATAHRLDTQEDQIAALRAELSEMNESMRKMARSSRASALGMATPALAAACLIGMVLMGRRRKGGAT